MPSPRTNYSRRQRTESELVAGVGVRTNTHGGKDRGPVQTHIKNMPIPRTNSHNENMPSPHTNSHNKKYADKLTLQKYVERPYKLTQ